MRITSREALITLVADHSPIRAVSRAVEESGTVENLGVFDRMFPDFTKMGWVVKVTTQHDRVYYVGVYIVGGPGRYLVKIKDNEPDWKHWNGDLHINNLFRGDYPDKYKELERIEDGKSN